MNVFISHATANKKIARTLAGALEAASKDVKTFVASRPGDIRADKDWLREIERSLKNAGVYIIILTPESVYRPWVNFESGAAWFFDRQLIFVKIQALPRDEIPLPIMSRQVYALDDVEQLKAIFQTIDLPLENPEELVKAFIKEAAEDVVTGLDEGAWEGIYLQGVFYAWAGHLLNLEDREMMPPPIGLLDEIKRRGLVPRWCNPDRVGKHIERGLSQVYATDKNNWRRPIMDNRRPLMVGNFNADK
jgi:hypothetical protein